MKNGLLLLLVSWFVTSLAFGQQQDRSILERLAELERKVAELTRENANLKERNKCFSYYTMGYNKPHEGSHVIVDKLKFNTLAMAVTMYPPGNLQLPREVFTDLLPMDLLPLPQTQVIKDCRLALLKMEILIAFSGGQLRKWIAPLHILRTLCI